MMDAKTGRLESRPQTARSVPSEEQTGNTGEVLTDGGTDTGPFRFDKCPHCDGPLHYPVKGEVECGDCETPFFHEIRGETHRLWSRTDKLGLKETVKKTEVPS